MRTTPAFAPEGAAASLARAAATPGATLDRAGADALVATLGAAARSAAGALAIAKTAQKDAALRAMAAALRRGVGAILAANAQDMADARAAGLAGALLDRLMLDAPRVEAMARGVDDVAALPDPAGAVLAEWTRPNGLRIQRVRVPIGVIGIVYESRPNVTADAGALCVKAGNAAILRGGSESGRSSAAIVACLGAGLAEAGLPAAAIQRVPTSDREAVGALLRADRYVDMIVPRGGKGLIERVRAEARVPVLSHLDGNCHTYLHAAAAAGMALEVAVNAKMRRTGICGATETLLVDRAAAARLLPPVLAALRARGCEIRGC
ncbi:MAG: glutamate-5-semialdehyde dehydrogenase, partial [Alphaproteobacteria bacterium]|nr:glutamate-5-semialdehyde dehydrogenase [Alphaproteobacteria bacterium]